MKFERDNEIEIGNRTIFLGKVKLTRRLKDGDKILFIDEKFENWIRYPLNKKPREEFIEIIDFIKNRIQSYTGKNGKEFYAIPLSYITEKFSTKPQLVADFVKEYVNFLNAKLINKEEKDEMLTVVKNEIEKIKRKEEERKRKQERELYLKYIAINRRTLKGAQEIAEEMKGYKIEEYVPEYEIEGKVRMSSVIHKVLETTSANKSRKRNVIGLLWTLVVLELEDKNMLSQFDDLEGWYFFRVDALTKYFGIEQNTGNYIGIAKRLNEFPEFIKEAKYFSAKWIGVKFNEEYIRESRENDKAFVYHYGQALFEYTRLEEEHRFIRTKITLDLLAKTRKYVVETNKNDKNDKNGKKEAFEIYGIRDTIKLETIIKNAKVKSYSGIRRVRKAVEIVLGRLGFYKEFKHPSKGIIYTINAYYIGKKGWFNAIRSLVKKSKDYVVKGLYNYFDCIIDNGKPVATLHNLKL